MKRGHHKGHKNKVNGMEVEGNNLSIQKKIAMRAYELYLQRGGEDGHAEHDWLQAEQDILKEEPH